MSSEKKVADVNIEKEVAEKDRVIFITGVSKGFGLLTAEALVKDGYKKVYGGSRSEPKLKDNNKKISFNWLKLDVTNTESIKKAIDAIIAKEQRLDILINNAGIALPACPISELDIKYYRNVFEVNYFGLINVTQLCLPHLLKNNGNKKQIINVSSCISLVALPFLSGYTSSKAAVDRLTEALSVELSAPLSNIKVQLCSPGPSNTEFDQSFISMKDKIFATKYKERFTNFMINGGEIRKTMNIPPEDVSKCLVDMVNNKLNDFRVYPGTSIKQVQFLNSNFNNNYSHNIAFCAHAVRTPEQQQPQQPAEKK